MANQAGGTFVKLIFRMEEDTFKMVSDSAVARQRTLAAEIRHLIFEAWGVAYAGEARPASPRAKIAGGCRARCRPGVVMVKGCFLPEQYDRIRAEAAISGQSFSDRTAGLLQRGLAALLIPSWAERAGLAEDYIDFCEVYGEEEAARRCRLLKREAAMAA